MKNISKKLKREAYELFLVEIPMLLDDLQELLEKSKKYKKIIIDKEHLNKRPQFFQ